ncbi:hypothetical protein J6590_083203 [Homalodisca vitripennis]|nr:hypothetical protein J6590_083203 [Homalodisca vitripennis]
MWWQHCNLDTAEYLETAERRVEPRYRNGLTPNGSSNKIAENQTLYVLAASSTVSVGWRGSLNKNWMRWQHYNADTAEYLEAAECRNQETRMNLLPLEVLNKIAENQTLYVLAASSTVNVGWRDCFNQNWMLWQHCNSDTAEYLETAERRV